MRKIFLIALITCFGFSCNKDFRTESIFMVTNNSSHFVKLKVFGVIHQNGQELTDTNFKIPHGQSVTIDYSIKTGEKDVDTDPMTEPFVPVDSALILFDDTLGIMYKPSDTNSRNILKKSSYTGGKTDKRVFRYLYSITDEDYIKAVRIK